VSNLVYVVGLSSHEGFEFVTVCATRDRAEVVRGLLNDRSAEIEEVELDGIFNHHLAGERLYMVHMSRSGDYYYTERGYVGEPSTTLTVTDSRKRWNGCLSIERWATSAEAVAAIADRYRVQLLEHNLWPEEGMNETPRVRAFFRYLESA
jgi:hypothetical protein